MKKILLIPIIFLSIIILPGCGKEEKKPVITNNNNLTSTVTTTTPKVIKMPETEAKPEHTFCESRGHELIIRFDKETQSSKAYCRFPDTTECEALSYMQGKCNPGNNSINYSPTTTEQPTKTIKDCPKNFDPVCGENGITFTNECIAASQNIKVVAIGNCQKDEEKEFVDKKINNNNSNSNNNINTSPPYWLPVITDMFILEPKSSPVAFVEKCIYDKTIVYYASYGCENCEDMLYNEEAVLICYPNKDLTKACPNYFDLKTKKNYCRRIWSDPR
ncbi:MAG TPA: Kazal-type serine protease inhibitor domain-containing protein [Candidatus Magasanikbacteria bacterium]|jgi:putative hemolysin|nr:DUF333 domain-containing protein [Candidatus Magasanikbacteria bacterium]HQF57257.1 Kazal-type serine protease inhibitor domain-containing protein [Candidatus Magasanikbacteria bacterium]HQL52614.1 Kazal-type serine protease inhibitor domain-containing protein [Candidatus Magasanikbacteria bacterium]